MPPRGPMWRQQRGLVTGIVFFLLLRGRGNGRVAVGITTISGAGYTCGVPVGGSVAALSGVEEPPGVGAGVGVAVSGVAVGAFPGWRFPA